MREALKQIEPWLPQNLILGMIAVFLGLLYTVGTTITIEVTGNSTTTITPMEFTQSSTIGLTCIIAGFFIMLPKKVIIGLNKKLKGLCKTIWNSWKNK